MNQTQNLDLDVIALTDAQHGILLETELSDSPGTYAGQTVLTFEAIDRQVLQAALDALSERHEVLRASYHWQGLSRPVMVVHRTAQIKLEFSDLSGLEEAEAKRLARHTFDEDIHRKIDFGTPPLARVRLVKLSEDCALVGLTTHHVAVDGWSTAILLRELREAYVSLARNGRAEFSGPPPPRYRVFSDWLANQAAPGGFWQEYLSGIELPTPVPLEAEPAETGSGRLTFAADDRLGRQIGAFCRQAKSTRAALVNALWGLTLSAFSGVRSTVHGMAVAGRPHDIAGSDRMVGMFMNTIPLRVDCVPVGTCRDFVRKVQESMIRLKDFEHASLLSVKAAVGMSTGEPFTSIVVVQNHSAVPNPPDSGTDADGWSLEETHYPMELVVLPGEELRLKLVFRTARVSAPLARRILDVFLALMQEVAANPAKPVMQIGYLGKDLQATDLDGATVGFSGADERIEALVRKRSSVSPQDAAVVFEDRCQSYADLAAASEAVSARLRRAGIGRGDIVGVLMERALDLPAVLLGVLGSGAAYLPLDPELPDSRLAFMTEDSGAVAVLAPEALADRVPPGVRKLVLEWPQADGPDQPKGKPVGTADDPAYVIYTSGSTGRPKGVVVPHRGVVNRILALQADHGLERQDRVLQKTPFGFDVSVWELFWPLVTGAGLVMARPGGHRDPAWLAAEIARTNVTVVHFVPSMLRGYAAVAPVSPGVRLVGCTGEALAPDQPGAARAVFPNAQIHNFYGPTETSIEVTSWRCDPEAAGPVPIGHAIANVSLQVLDEAGRVLPDGAVGELVVGGPCVATGYLGRPGLTAERFVPDPTGGAGARAYRTGDRVRVGRGGALDYLGRDDDQVKVRGHRIEIGEVEAALAGVPGVRGAAAVVRQDGGGTARLIGYVAGGPGPKAVAECLARDLPAYMIPAPIIELDDIPLTNSGKTDRKKLPEHDFAAQETEPLLGDTEKMVGSICCDVLGIDTIGRNIELTALGASSIDHMRIAGLIRSRMNVDIELRQVFEAATVQVISEHVVKAAASSDEAHANRANLPPLIKLAHSQPVPLSFAQERLWFLDKLGNMGSAYSVPIAFRMTGSVNERALEKAIRRLASRHEILSTRFEEKGGAPEQYFDPNGRVRLKRHTLYTDPDPELSARAMLEQLAALPFDLNKDLPIRAHLLKLAEEEYIFLLVLQHIACDGWSLEILTRELSTFYNEAVGGPEATLPPLAVQYSDFAVWQRGWLQGEVLEEQVAYWRSRLEGAPSHLPLPADHARPAVQDYRGGNVPVAIDAELSEAVRAFAAAQGVTVFMVLLGAFQVLLARWSGQWDVTVGTPIANRRDGQLEPLVGFFANTLALRAEMGGEQSFASHVDEVRARTLEAFAHQDLPFEKLVEELSPERDLSRHPVFQAMLAFQGRAQTAPSARLDGLKVRPEAVSGSWSKFDLTLFVTDADGALQGRLEYASALFERGTAEEISRSFTSLLTDAIRRPDHRLAELVLASGPAEDKQASGLEAGPGPSPEHEQEPEQKPEGEPRLEDLFRAAAGRAGSAPAVRCGGEDLAYGSLLKRVDALSARLGTLGIGRGDVVGVLMRRGIDLPAAVLGILGSGAAYLPMDPDHPVERLRDIARDAGVGAVLTHSVLRETGEGITPQDAAMLLIDRPGEDPIGSHWGTGRTVPPDTAYVIYTSGSTGRPKGVVLPHSAVAAYLLWARDAYLGTQADWGGRPLALLHGSFAYDMSVTSLFLPLICGGCLEVLPDGEDLAVLSRVFAASGAPVVLKLTPAHALAIADQFDPACGPDVLVLGGEALPAAGVERLRARLPGSSIVNEYGPTETAVGCSVHWCGSGEADPVAIGSAITGARLRVASPLGADQPKGAVGELMIGGAGVAHGYLGRPSLTAERFVPDPAGGAGARAYRTGDIARRRADGLLEYLGRSDDQVKIRGYRVELGEVEAALTTLEGVRNAAVIPHREGNGSASLLGHVVAEEGVTLEDLETRLSGRLPGYMVPRLVAADALPLDANGKVDRRALAELAPPEAPGEGLPARPGLEQGIALVWGDLLERDPVARDGNFFTLGGHSLLAMRAVTALRARTGHSVNVRTVFEHPTPEKLARHLQSRTDSGVPGLELPALTRRSDRGPAPLSFAQERLWFIDQLGVTGSGYNVPIALRLTGALSSQDLETAIRGLVQRHEILRTRFTETNGKPVQHAGPEEAVHFAKTDFSKTLDPEQAVREQLETLASEPFDLRREYPVRSHLFRLADEEHVLVVILHHIACDGWSMGILARDLSALYNAVVGNAAAALPHLPVQYSDFARWQREDVPKRHFTTRLDWWCRKLSGAETLDLPTDHPRPSIQDFTSDSVEFSVPQDVAAALASLGQEHGATLFMVLLASFAVALGGRSGQSDIVVGTPVANRHPEETEELVGFFVNSLPLRVELDWEASFESLLAQVRDTTLASLEHQEVPFERLVETLAPLRDLSRHPVFQVCFVLQTKSNSQIDLNGLQVKTVPIPSAGAKFDLTLTMTEMPDGLIGSIEYAVSLFERETVARIASEFGELLSQIVRRLAGNLSDLADAVRPPALPSACAFAGAARRIDGAVFEQVSLAGSGIAVSDGSVSLSYADLWSASGQVASRLVSAGVPAGSVVGVVLERSACAVIAQLGVLRAGCVVMPVETDYPAARIALMFEAGAARLVITDAEHEGLVADLPVLRIDDPVPATGFEEGERRGPEDAGAPAYLLFTSGSTGRPKGVLIPHGAVTTLMSEREVLCFGAQDTLMLASPLSFDASLLEIWGALLNGGRIAVLPAGPFDPDAIASFLPEAGVTAAWLTAGLLRGFLDRDPAPFEGLRLLVSGGDVFPVQGLSRFMSRLPGVRLVNGYGPSESTTFTTLYRLEGAPEPGASVPIGSAVAGRRAVVLDERLRPVPFGAPGELHIGGTGLALGYAGAPGRTAEHFVPDPSGGGRRLYQTGDRVRQRNEGVLEFLGRGDSQVKVRGFRVEPGEVEAALCSLPGVRDGAVAVHRNREGSASLVGHVVVEEGFTLENLETSLSDRLPGYMVPRLVAADALPLDANGKVDRRSLAELAPPEDAEEGAPARPGLEHGIASVWGDLLERDPVARDGNFFTLGGHSLLAMRAVTALRAITGHSVNVRTIFEYPTPEKLARFISKGGQEEQLSSTCLVSLSKGKVPPIYLLPPAGGGVSVYRRLADNLVNRTVFGFVAPGLEPGSQARSFLSELAEFYAFEIDKSSGGSAVTLGGWSFGAIVALEVARLLGADQVEKLVLIDPAIVSVGQVAHIGSDGVLQTAFDQDRAQLHKLIGTDQGIEDQASLIRARSVFESNVKALERYVLEDYEGTSALIFAADGVNKRGASHWQVHLPNSDFAVLPGDHYSLFDEESVPDLACFF